MVPPKDEGLTVIVPLNGGLLQGPSAVTVKLNVPEMVGVPVIV